MSIIIGQALGHQVHDLSRLSIDGFVKQVGPDGPIEVGIGAGATVTINSVQPYILTGKPLGMGIFTGGVYADTGEVYTDAARTIDRTFAQIGRQDLGDSINAAIVFNKSSFTLGVSATYTGTRDLILFFAIYAQFDESGLATIGL